MSAHALHVHSIELQRKHESQKAIIMRYIEQVNQLDSKLACERAYVDQLEAINAELLAALKRAIEAGEGWMDDSCGRINDPAFQAARRLIAKADGNK